MVQSMAADAAAGVLSAWISAFATFDEAHGFAVNLFAVAALAVIGGLFLTGRRRLVRPAVIAFAVLCLADWVLIEDFGFLGGLGTDPNSMVPFALLAIAGYLALVPGPVAAVEPATAARTGDPAGGRGRLAGTAPAGLGAARRGGGELRHGRVARRGRADHPRRGADGRRPGQPERRPDPRPGHHRVDRAAELPRQRIPRSPTSTARP